jgi:hypothetical protein
MYIQYLLVPWRVQYVHIVFTDAVKGTRVVKATYVHYMLMSWRVCTYSIY